MKYIKDIRYNKKLFIGLAFVLIISFVISNYMLVTRAPKDVNLSIFDLLCLPTGGGILGPIQLNSVILPIYLIMILKLISSQNSPISIVRQKGRKGIWREDVKFILQISFMYSALIIIFSYIISGIMIGSFSNLWGSEEGYLFFVIKDINIINSMGLLISTPALLMILFASLFLGLALIGSVVAILSLYIKSTYIFLVFTILVVLDVLTSKFNIILGHISLNIDKLINPSCIVIEDLFFLISIVILYYLGKSLIQDKDFLR